MLFLLWPNVFDAGPRLRQHWVCDACSLHVSPNCEHCKHLQDYIIICEEAAKTLRDEIEKLKQQASLKSDTSPTPTPPPSIPTETTRKHHKRTTKPKIAVVVDSNGRNLYKHFDHTVTDNTVWVNAGCKLEDVKSRAHDMLKNSDVGVACRPTNTQQDRTTTCRNDQHLAEVQVWDEQ